MNAPVRIPFPLSSFPGANPQEGAGRLINCYAEPLGEPARPSAPAEQVWRGSAGLSQHAITTESGYRGGLLVKNLSYEVFQNAAVTVDAAGDVIVLGNMPGTKKVSIARDMASNPDVVAVDVDNGAYILNTAALANASITATIAQSNTLANSALLATIAGASFVAGDTVGLTFTNASVPAFPVTVTYAVAAGSSATIVATGLTALINGSATLAAAGITATSAAGVVTIAQQAALASYTTVSSHVTGTGSETVTFSPASGVMTGFVAGDTVGLIFENTGVSNLPVTITTTVAQAATAAQVAANLTALINANVNLAAAGITATVAGAVITIIQPGALGNTTSVTATISGTGSETVTFSTASSLMTGGAGTPGIVFGGAPISYNGGGNLPQPNGVAFQDGYFFYTIASGQCYASALNSLIVNALTYITCQAHADVTLLRPIAFSGVLLLFTTGSCEVWQDNANPAPAFPYARILVLEFGLVQSAAIAGWETGFSELMWVAQDYGVYWLTAQSLAPVKVSPSDLDRLIEVQVKAGNLLEAGCYSEGGKKFWHISSPAWSWEFNLSTKKWNERWSLNNGVYGRWRATGGHPAFGKWLVGDEQSGNLLYLDATNFTENGAPMLFRIESGPVKAFPQQLRIARADFDFDMGVGQVEGNYQMTVLGAAAGTNGVVRLTVNATAQAKTGDEVQVAGVLGTTEANGVFPLTVVDVTHIELQGTKFVNAYTSGGTATDITAPPGATSPQCAISCSKNGGQSFDVPSLRSLAPLGKIKRSRASVKNRGQSGPMGVRWRIDITDPVYRGFMGATMSANPRNVSP